VFSVSNLFRDVSDKNAEVKKQLKKMGHFTTKSWLFKKERKFKF